MAKKTAKKIEKAVKKTNPFVLILFVLIFAVCGIGGYFLGNHLIRNDKFEIIGEKTITLEVGQTYTDEGAVAISFGKDLTSKIVAENNIDFNTAGQYYIRYSVNDIRYKGVYRYRTIIIADAGEVGNE